MRVVGTLKLKLKPTLGEAPIAFDGCAADAESFGDFGFGEADEELQFDDTGLAGIDLFEAGEGLVNGDDVDVGMSGGGVVLERRFGCTAAAAFSQAGSGMIDQDAAHHGGGEGEEVAPVFDFDGGLSEHADIKLMDKSGGLKGMILTLPHEGAAGKDAQLVVELFDEGVAGG